MRLVKAQEQRGLEFGKSHILGDVRRKEAREISVSISLFCNKLSLLLVLIKVLLDTAVNLL